MPLRALAVLTAAGALLIASTAEAETVTVSGKVQKSAGYTLSVVAKSGAGRAVRLGARGRFSVSLPAAKARDLTLSLISPTGRYYGPVLLSRATVHRKRVGYVVLSGRSSVKLGAIALKGRYAQPAKPVSRAKLDVKRLTTLTSTGVPIGAGKLGLVKTKRIAAARAAQAGPPAAAQQSLGADDDGDGLINAYDVDDDGDGILDSEDPDAPPSQNQLGYIFSNLWATSMTQSLNADAHGVTPAAIDALLEDQLNVVMQVDPEFDLPGERLQSVNVDCGQLAYCRAAGGTGELTDPQEFGATVPANCPGATMFVQCDPDHDGLPNLAVDARRPDSGIYTGAFFPRVAFAQISPADTMVFHIATERSKVDYASTVGPFFVTTPVVKSIGGYAPTYPVGPTDPGTGNNGDHADHDMHLPSTTVTYVVYRPQRPAIPGAESGSLMDMGHLSYTVADPVSNVGGGCPLDAYSDLSPTLKPEVSGPQKWLVDSADDAPPSPDNTISFTVDFAKCVAEDGGPSLAGQTVPLGVSANTPRGQNTFQKFWVHFPDGP